MLSCYVSFREVIFWSAWFETAFANLAVTDRSWSATSAIGSACNWEERKARKNDCVFRVTECTRGWTCIAYHSMVPSTYKTLILTYVYIIYIYIIWKLWTDFGRHLIWGWGFAMAHAALSFNTPGGRFQWCVHHLVTVTIQRLPRKIGSNTTHRIHVWNIYLYSLYIYHKCKGHNVIPEIYQWSCFFLASNLDFISRDVMLVLITSVCAFCRLTRKQRKEDSLRDWCRSCLSKKLEWSREGGISEIQ